MKPALRMIPALMVVGLTTLAVAPAPASGGTTPPPAGGQLPPGARLTQECLERMRLITAGACDDIRDRTRMTIRRIISLKQAGAPNEAIVAAGEQGKTGVAARAGAGASAVNTAAMNCVQMLQGMNAPQAFVDAVQEGRARSLETIVLAKQAADRAIDAAVARATAPAGLGAE